MPKSNTLTLSNGHWDYRDTRIRGLSVVHCYVGAYSGGDAVRLLRQAGRTNSTMYEYRKYWNTGAWGTAMKAIEPERGVWVSLEDGTIERLV